MNNKKKDNIIDFPSSPTKVERQVEAILFAASEPLDVETIEERIETSVNLKKVLENLQEIYKKRGINLVCIKNRWSFRTAEDLSKTIIVYIHIFEFTIIISLCKIVVHLSIVSGYFFV